MIKEKLALSLAATQLMVLMLTLIVSLNGISFKLKLDVVTLVLYSAKLDPTDTVTLKVATLPAGLFQLNVAFANIMPYVVSLNVNPVGLPGISVVHMKFKRYIHIL